jgi:hypothetical protein
MIKNAIIHIQNEQPLLADLFEMPKALDQGLLCTNLRMLDGKRPIFIEKSESTFFFPYLFIRFVEVMPGSSGEPGAGDSTKASAPVEVAEEPELELDEEFLRRIRDV